MGIGGSEGGQKGKSREEGGREESAEERRACSSEGGTEVGFLHRKVRKLVPSKNENVINIEIFHISRKLEFLCKQPAELLYPFDSKNDAVVMQTSNPACRQRSVLEQHQKTSTNGLHGHLNYSNRSPNCESNNVGLNNLNRCLLFVDSQTRVEL